MASIKYKIYKNLSAVVQKGSLNSVSTSVFRSDKCFSCKHCLLCPPCLLCVLFQWIIKFRLSSPHCPQYVQNPHCPLHRIPLLNLVVYGFRQVND